MMQAVPALSRLEWRHPITKTIPRLTRRAFEQGLAG